MTNGLDALLVTKGADGLLDVGVPAYSCAHKSHRYQLESFRSLISAQPDGQLLVQSADIEQENLCQRFHRHGNVARHLGETCGGKAVVFGFRFRWQHAGLLHHRMKPDLDKVRLRQLPFLQPQHVDEVFASRRKRAVAFAVIRSQFGHTCEPTEVILKQRPAQALRRQLAAERRAASSSSITPSPPSDGGEGRGEEVRFYWLPLLGPLPTRSSRGEDGELDAALRRSAELAGRWNWGV